MNAMAQASAALRRAIRAVAKVEVTYHRVGGLARSVMATAGQTMFGTSESAGGGQAITTKWESRDFLIDVADLEAVGIAGEPKRGDRIKERDGPALHVYEVRSPEGEPHWRFSDNYRRTFRIHTKHVGTEMAPA